MEMKFCLFFMGKQRKALMLSYLVLAWLLLCKHESYIKYRPLPNIIKQSIRSDYDLYAILYASKMPHWQLLALIAKP